MSIKFGTREYWSNHIDGCIETLKNDKEKLLDLILDRCIEMDITIPIHIGEAPQYRVSYSKSCYIDIELKK